MGLFEILAVFYLYLLVRRQHIRRPNGYLIGVAGLMLATFAKFFALEGGRELPIVAGILRIVGELAALKWAVLTCYTGQVPMAGLLDRIAPVRPEPGSEAPPDKP